MPAKTQTRKEASIRARQDANLHQLDSFGTSRDDVAFQDELTPIERALGRFIERVHSNLESEQMIVTGEIADIRMQRHDDRVDVTANNYLLYQDKGVNGAVVKLYDTPYSYKDKKPPIESLQAWADQKGVNVYYLQDKIFKEGIKPRNVYTKELDGLVDDLKKEIAGFMIQQIKFNL